MFFKNNQNILWKAAVRALPYLLIIYFISFRSYFLLQQFFVQNEDSATSYFDVSKVGDSVTKVFAKIISDKDSSPQKRAIPAFAHEYEFLQIENFNFIFLLFAIIFYCKTRPRILSPPLSYRTRAPPVIC